MLVQSLGCHALHAKAFAPLVFPQVVAARLFGAAQWRREDQRASLALTFLQEVWEGPAVALRQAQGDDDGEDGEEGQDEVEKVVEVSLEVHQEGGSRACTVGCQHQAEAAATGGRISNNMW